MTIVVNDMKWIEWNQATKLARNKQYIVREPKGLTWVTRSPYNVKLGQGQPRLII